MLCDVFNGETGLVVAIIGSDGAGKSTLCRDLAEELRQRGPVDSIYFGSGDGTSSWLRWPLVQLRRVITTSPKSTAPRPADAPLSVATDERRRGRCVTTARTIWALTLAWEKRGKLRAAARARQRGRLVVCDRFPQAQVGGLMDGPLLHAWTSRGRGFRRMMASLEARPYVRAELEPPDLVLRLIVDQEHAQQRRPEHDPVDLARRRAIVEALRFDGAEFGVVDLDSSMPADDVRRAAMLAIDQCRNGARRR
jgi:energy-coupling factor transporter ATP-binding protein EcfA2